jgi:hypothetical protein
VPSGAFVQAISLGKYWTLQDFLPLLFFHIAMCKRVARRRKKHSAKGANPFLLANPVGAHYSQLPRKMMGSTAPSAATELA